MNNLDKILEGLLFLSGDGLDRGIIMEKLQVTPKELDKAIEKLKERYNEDCGINFITYKDKLQLCGSPKFADDVSLVLNPIRERQLTRATLEVMAIIAYKQPVTRLDVQDIRGINSDYAIQTLLNYKLIEVVGRKDAVGKPLLFGTTDEFLRHFGINSLDELPDYAELMKSVEQIQLENNHLYNEFELPDDEKNIDENEAENLDKSDEKKYENLDKKTDELDMENAQNDVPLAQSKPENSLDDNNFENISEGIDYSALEEAEMEDLAYENKNDSFDKKEEQIEQTQQEDVDGIDWSLLEDNPDIEA